MSLRKPNPDKVSGPVVGGGFLGLIIGGVARALIDRYANPADAEMWWNITQTLLLTLPAIGAWLGGLRAKRNVTPVTRDAIPRDLQGRELAPVSHDPAGGYPTRLATPEERRRPPTTDFP